VHICCSVDSHFFLQKLQLFYPKKEYDGWLRAVRGFECEPEKEKRCSVCFDNRLEITAKKAIELGINEITTTLLTSPKKSIKQLRQNALHVEQKYSLQVHTPDFRVKGGTQEQFIMAKKEMLYHQNYCGCMFALEKQRESQNKLKDELMCPITKQVLPSSIEDRTRLYNEVINYEKKEEKFRLKREKFLNFRLLSGSVNKVKKGIIPSFILFYSTLKKGFTKGKIELIEDGIGYFNREEILILGIEEFNFLTNSCYKSVIELMKKPLHVEEELELRKKLGSSILISLNPIIIIDKLEFGKYEIIIKSKTYIDVREILVKI